MDITKAIGYTAGILTTMSFLPQVIQTIRTRSARGLSIGMLFLFIFGNSLWLIYGLVTRQMPIIVTNAITLGLVVVLFICKFVYK